MISFLKGELFQKKNEKITLLVNNVGYDILLPKIVADELHDIKTGAELSLFIYFYQTERQPKPTLIGFLTEEERDFFEQFLRVEAIGPQKAVTALCAPLGEIACAIENRDVAYLKKLKGVGNRTALKIVATLSGKMAGFSGEFKTQTEKPQKVPADDFRAQVLNVLVGQLGHTPGEAREMVAKAMKRKPEINNPEDLFDEVYRKVEK